jgi:hypothetical protein
MTPFANPWSFFSMMMPFLSPAFTGGGPGGMAGFSPFMNAGFAQGYASPFLPLSNPLMYQSPVPFVPPMPVNTALPPRVSAPQTTGTVAPQTPAPAPGPMVGQVPAPSSFGLPAISTGPQMSGPEAERMGHEPSGPERGEGRGEHG